MSDQERSIPSELNFSAKDVKAASQRRQLAPGYYRFVITGAQRKIAEKGTMMIETTCAPLKDPADVDSKSNLSVRNNIIVPLANPDKPGHEAPNTAGLCHSYYKAILTGDEALPDYPRYDKETRTFSQDGAEVDKDEVDGLRLEVNEALFERLKSDWEQPANLLDFVFYAEAYNNNGFLNLKNISAEPADGVEINEPKAATSTESESETEAPAKTKTNGKTNGKAKGLKKGKR